MSGAVRPCPACGDRLDDAACGPASAGCFDVWQLRHEIGDHRRCERFSWPCETALSHPAIREAARAAMARTGRTLAVVCLACENGPRVVGTFADDLWSAKGLRNSHARRHRLGLQEKKGVVHVVDEGGTFL